MYEKIITLLIVFALLGSMTTVAIAKTGLSYHLGDVDGNGKIEATDALLILKSLVGKVELNDAQQDAAQIAVSDEIGAEAALLILKKVVNKIRHFPTEIIPIVFEQPQQEQGGDTVHYLANAENGCFAIICNTYEEYVAFLNSDRIRLFVDSNGNPTMDRELSLFPLEYFEQGNRLLLYYFNANSVSTRSRVKEAMMVKTTATLEVVIETSRPSAGQIVPGDYAPKLYVCKLLDCSRPIDKICVIDKQLKGDEIIKTEIRTY